MSDSSAETLLDYAVTTGPEQLQVSPPDGNPSYGTVTIVVSNPSTTTPVQVQQIQLSAPIGPNATDLTTAPAVRGILATASPPAEWQIAQTAAGVFTATPVAEHGTITGTGLAFRLSNIAVNQQVGTVPLTVRETASAEGGPVSSAITLRLPKFPYGFFVSHFTADAPRVANGGTVTLSWAGSDGATYTILFDGQTDDVSMVRTWTSPPLVRDTTFFLTVTAQSQGETVTKRLSVTVTVAEPSLAAHDLTVRTDATVTGTSTLGPVAAASASLQGGLTALGTSRIGPPPEAGSLAQLTVNAAGPNPQAINATNASRTAACAFFRNTAPPLSDGLVSGLGVVVTSASAVGLWTNGLIASAGGTAAIAHLPTAQGARAVTSPLSLDPEIHLSGTGQLSDGTATVALHPDAAGVIFHGDEAPYRVLLTPTRTCNGLAVTRKDADGFTVEELAGGRSAATFDWFLVAHRRESPDSPERALLPEITPQI
ncbi:hypothetical protein [Actinomadura napierensis]|uniref:Uncharacterized protein n=1 Tax=Actinomadura napierensis TaxID=267854 RepID=A0ABN2ZKP2_9ACTN